MPIRTWGYVVALGLSLSASLLGAQERPNEDQVEEQPRQAEPAPQRPVEAPAREVRPKPAQVPGPDHDGGPEPDGEPRAEDDPTWPWLGDGLAQWIMAGLSIPAVILSGWAVVLLRRTLKSTDDTLRQSQKAVEAAQEANRIAAESGAIDQRPWVSIGTPEFTFIKVMPSGFQGRDRSLWLDFKVPTLNTGKTPALNVLAMFTIDHMDSEGHQARIKSLQAHLTQPSQGLLSLGPNEPHMHHFNAVIDFDLPKGDGPAWLSLTAFVSVTYGAFASKEPKGTAAHFWISQDQDERDANIRPLRIEPPALRLDSFDALNLEVRTVEFRRIGGTMT